MLALFKFDKFYTALNWVGSSVDLLKRGAGSLGEDNGHYCTRFCWIGHTGPSLTSSFLSP